MIKSKIILTLLLVFCAVMSNSQELYRKGVWGTYAWGSPWEDADFTRENYPYVKGAPIVLRWSELEPEPGKYQFEKLIGEKLKHADREDFYTMLSIWVGPSSPGWIYENGVPLLEMEKTINPFGKVRDWKFPYYLDEDYKNYFFRMIDNLGEYILSLPGDLQKRLVFVQSAEGSTGDGWPYKGKPLDLSYDITRDEWTSFRFETWKRFTDALSSNGKNKIPVLVNYDSCTDEEYAWLLNNMQAVGLKNGMFSHGYHISYGKTRLASWNDFKRDLAEKNRQFFSRGEQDGEWEIYGWSTQNPEQAFYWSAIYATHNGLSMWNVPLKASKGERMKDAMAFFNRYANEHDPETATAAFCALRKGLDASDVVNYPEDKFGKAEMNNVSRYLKIAESYKAYGARQGDPEKAAGIIDSQILGDAGEYDKVAQASMTNAGMINRKRQDYNDVGWEILDGNYERFIEQIDPEGTSYGWWHKGPEQSVYSRFARSTDKAKGNSLYFDVHDGCNFDGEIAIRLVWLDEGNAKWQLTYNGTGSSESLAYSNSNTNSGEWKEKTIVLHDAKFRNSGTRSSDIVIQNLSENESIVFHLVEILKESAGIYDATLPTDEALAILTPAPAEKPRINGADIFGAKPGNQCFFKIAATGKQPLEFDAKGLPKGLHLNTENGVISGKAPAKKGEYKVTLTVTNSVGKASEELLIVVGDDLALTPVMGWCSWYAFNIHVTDNDIRRMADAMERYNLVNYGWAYANIDNGWQATTRNPETKAIQSNEKFPDMKALADYLHEKGIKFGMYSSLWMSCFRGYMGATAPNEQLDYSAFTIPLNERETPETLFGSNKHRFKFSGSSQVGPVWLADIDSRQYAGWGVDMMKYDYNDRTYEKGEDGEYLRDENGQLIEYTPDNIQSYKDEKNLERIVSEQNSFGRDIVFSSSPVHDARQDAMMSQHANMWRITNDIKPVWEDIERALGAELHERITTHTKPGHYADLDMLQIGPKYESFTKDRAPLTAQEQYTMVSLWALLAQPMLLSCDLDLISEFTLNLMTNYEVIDINQDRLCKPAERFELDDTGRLLLYKKTLNNGQYALGLFNVSDEKQVVSFSPEQLDLDGKWMFRDVWRQQDIGRVSDAFTATLDGHGSLLLVLEKE